MRESFTSVADGFFIFRSQPLNLDLLTQMKHNTENIPGS